MDHEVFISYSSANIQTAQAICHALESNRINCWMAPRDIRPERSMVILLKKLL